MTVTDSPFSSRIWRGHAAGPAPTITVSSPDVFSAMSFLDNHSVENSLSSFG